MFMCNASRAVSKLTPKIFSHPFNKAMFHGTLPRAMFQFYLEQDALYLLDFSYALKTISGRVSDCKSSTLLNNIAKQTFTTERAMQIKYLQRYGVSIFDQHKIKKVVQFNIIPDIYLMQQKTLLLNMP